MKHPRLAIVPLAIAAAFAAIGCNPSPYKHGGQHSNPHHGPIAQVRSRAELPPPAAAAFAKEFPGAKVTETRAITHTSGAEHFEILYISADGKAGVVEFDKDGKLLR